jgi:anti-sigma B factor antagonist
VDVTSQDGVMVVALTDRKILDEINITQIGEQLTGLIAQGDNPKMAIDFTNVDHMSSSALGMLITLHKRIREKGGRLVLCCIQPAIYEVFVITRLNEIFEIRETRDEAMEALK